MTNPNYYHHQKQEDATRARAPLIETKAVHSQSTIPKEGKSIIASSPLRRSIASNSASSSPLSFSLNNITSYNPGNNSNLMTKTDHDASMGDSTSYAQQYHHSELEHRFYNSTPHNSNNILRSDTFSRGPLSPQSAPPSTTDSGCEPFVSTSTTPVPSVIHTEAGMDGEITMTRARTHGSTPYFPSINKSSSGNMSMGSISGSSNLIAKKSASKVTGKKKHQISKPKSGSNTTMAQFTSSPRPHDSGSGSGGTTNGQKKQRRLERNRLSAQLSRRRRKQYLEELEDRVVRLSLDMDSGRRAHAFQAIDRISEMRQEVLGLAESLVREIESYNGSTEIGNNSRTMMLEFRLGNYMRLLENAGPLSRTNSEELLILNSFLGQQLKSFSLPSHTKFILWLSLQGDLYYRGGRAASERLSAARIGERMLANGNDKVTPTNAMWPLVCNEVGLSYELEERLRVYQITTILQEKSTWLDRHTARSSALLMQSFHDSLGGMTHMVGNRESAMTKKILTPSQRVKYLVWAGKNSNRIKARLQARRQRALQQEEELKIKLAQTDGNNIDIGTYVDSSYQLHKSHHLAANLYILNHQLLRILKDFPYRSPSILTPPVLKKLMRRASFESLGQLKDTDGRALSREDSSTSSGSMLSLPSNGSLFKSASNLSLGLSSAPGINDSERPAHISPQVGEQAAVELVDQALGFVNTIIPPISKPMNPVLSTLYVPAHTSQDTTGSVPSQGISSSMAIDYHSHHLVPAPVSSYGAPAQLAPAPPSNQHVTPTIHFEGVSIHHLPNHPPAHLNTHNYSASRAQTHVSSQVQHANTSYQQPQPEHYYPPQQHIHYAPSTSTTSAHGQQITSIDHESIAPVYETSSSIIQHQQPRPSTTTSRHERKSSFLPASFNSLNVVPEDMFPGVEGTDADFIELQDCLMDGEDWGIGIGLDMDTTT